MNEFDWNGRNVHFYESIDSTNVQAKRMAEEDAPSGTVIVADMQTAGRGRRGRIWESPAGTNLYFTLIVRPDLSPDKASMLTLVMALAVAKGVEGIMNEVGDKARKIFGGEQQISNVITHPLLQIKWPNDIIINGRKVCGILTEMCLQTGKQGKISHVLIGVGVNVQKQDFAPELVDKATDIETECGQKISRKDLLAGILEAFEEYYAIFERCGNLAELRELYNRKLVNRGREVRVLDPQGEFTGIATGINDTGELCVTLPDGSVTQVYAGEVSVRGIYGYV